MKALALIPGTTVLSLVERPEPKISAPDEVKIQVLEVGICGTDREEASGGRAEPPEGEKELIIGHEMIGRVIEVGSAVTRFHSGDYAVLTVRRGCNQCPACRMGRSDMCYTGQYTERGIKGRDGYQTEYVVDRERYLIKVADRVRRIGVLTEPMSICEKAVAEAVLIQTSRLPDRGESIRWLEGKAVLVAGIGTIGLLAAFALRLRGARVFGLGREDAQSFRPSVLARIGAEYVDERQIKVSDVGKHVGPLDLILEATGAALLEFDLLSALGNNGAYVLTGIPGGDRPIDIDGAALIRRLVLGNQVMLGSVNASQENFQSAIEDLERASDTWGNAVEDLITHRFPYPEFAQALSLHSSDEVKTVVEWKQLS